jgi:hypothetical protein
LAASAFVRDVAATQNLAAGMPPVLRTPTNQSCGAGAAPPTRRGRARALHHRPSWGTRIEGRTRLRPHRSYGEWSSHRAGWVLTYKQRKRD